MRVSRRIFPFIQRVFADSGYAGEKVAKATSIGRDRRLAKDFEATIGSARAFLYAASVMRKLRRVGLLCGSLRGPLLKGGAFKDRLAGSPFHFIRCCVGHARFPPKSGFLLERRSPSQAVDKSCDLRSARIAP